MPYEELIQWSLYFQTRPIGWRDDDRTFKLLQAQGYKGKPHDAFHSLDLIYNKPSSVGEGDTVSVTSLRGSSMLSRMNSAIGGEFALTK